MKTIAFLVVCIQALLIQNVFGQCSGPIIPKPCGYVSNVGSNAGIGGIGYGGYPAGSGYSGSGYGSQAGYGGYGEGYVSASGDIPVSGNSYISGAVPIAGLAEFSGNVPAYGVVTVSGSCGCSCNGY